ncbi:MAG: caspase family protein [Desulfobacteraceae bacterium]|nr:caspase family protein [Desulfobacteraceae bacterium]
MKKITLIKALILFFLISPVYARSDDSLCEAAKDIAKKAEELSKKDKKESLTLFIKAKRLCDRPEYDYNLGIAYWRYGAPEKAVESMYGAVSKKKNPKWLNNLSFMLIKTGKNKNDALKFAGEAYESDKNNPSYAETFIQANLYYGNEFEAVKLAKNFYEKWPSNEKISDIKNIAYEKYLTKYLTYIKNNNYEKGIAGLEKASDIIPGAARGYALSLLSSGKNEEALHAASEAEKKFKNKDEVKGLFDEISNKTVKKFYDEFQAGNEKKAIALSKNFADRYPDSKIAKETYNRILNAFINAADVSVPDSVQIVQSEKINKDSDAILASLFEKSKSDENNYDLVSDIEKNIPKTKIRNSDGVAVVIGNRRYEKYNKGIKDVVYAERDAAVMKKYLINTLGFEEENIIYHLNATSGDLRDIFGTKENRNGKLARYIREKRSDVFIYYSGHGAPGPKGDSSYLVPVDASADFIANNGYSLDLFYEQIDRLEAKSVMVVLESCFSGDSDAGPLFENISPALVKNISPVENVKNASVFCSADKNQVATWYPEKRHGMFTYFFLKGLSGNADKNKDNQISVNELYGYLSGEVKYWAGRKSNRTQTPVFKGDTKRIVAVLK